MSESFEGALSKVNYGKYIDEIQAELERAVQAAGPEKSPRNTEFVQERLQEVIRKQSMRLAKEIGFLGDQAMVFMTATSILSTAWVSFALRRETTDLTKSPEDRLATIELFDALGSALGRVIDSASSYADSYQPSAAGADQVPEKTD